MKKFVLYAIRWQASGLILAPCLTLFYGFGIVWATIIANFIGAMLFFFLDKWIFKEEK